MEFNNYSINADDIMSLTSHLGFKDGQYAWSGIIPVNRDFHRKQSNHKIDQSMKTDHFVLLFTQML